jgi:hypothetical protein
MKPSMMDFDQTKAFEAGQEAAMFLEKAFPGAQLAQLVSQIVCMPGIGDEMMRQARELGTPVQRGRVVKAMVEAVKAFIERNRELPLPVERFELLRDVVNLDPIVPKEKMEELDSRERELDRKDLAAGVPLDELLPANIEPEDEYWLRGFEERLAELRAIG